MVPGSADQSYGIQVAKLAGIPQKVIARAQEILEELEKSEFNESSILEKTKRKKAEINQTSFIEVLSQKTSKERALIEELKNLDVNALTPIQALTFLSKLKEKL